MDYWVKVNKNYWAFIAAFDCVMTLKIKYITTLLIFIGDLLEQM